MGSDDDSDWVGMLDILSNESDDDDAPLPPPPSPVALAVEEDGGAGGAAPADGPAAGGPAADEAPPPPAGPARPGRRRGVAPECGVVAGLGYININLNPAAMSLDAHCDVCKSAVNRGFLPHASRPDSHPKGRPMGALLAWFRLGCDGNARAHKERFTAGDLPFVDRVTARQLGEGVADLAKCFDKERDPDYVLDGESNEPYQLP